MRSYFRKGSQSDLCLPDVASRNSKATILYDKWHELCFMPPCPCFAVFNFLFSSCPLVSKIRWVFYHAYFGAWLQIQELILTATPAFLLYFSQQTDSIPERDQTKLAIRHNAYVTPNADPPMDFGWFLVHAHYPFKYVSGRISRIAFACA